MSFQLANITIIPHTLLFINCFFSYPLIMVARSGLNMLKRVKFPWKLLTGTKIAYIFVISKRYHFNKTKY